MSSRGPFVQPIEQSDKLHDSGAPVAPSVALCPGSISLAPRTRRPRETPSYLKLSEHLPFFRRRSEPDADTLNAPPKLHPLNHPHDRETTCSRTESFTLIFHTRCKLEYSCPGRMGDIKMSSCTLCARRLFFPLSEASFQHAASRGAMPSSNELQN